MKKTLIGLSIAAAALFAANNYEIGIAGGRNNVNNSPIENYNFLNLRAGKYLSDNNILRFEYERSEKILNNKQRLQRALLNYEYDFNTNSFFTPYTFIGGGYQWVSGNYRNTFVGDAGLGSKFSITDNLSWFAEIRGLRDFYHNDNHFGGIIGLIYNFGNSAARPASNNSSTVTSNNSVNSTQTSKASSKTINTVHKVLDSDNDGVPNNLDKCPNTPKGVKVNVNGCPIDSDHDGVPNYLDKCPNTPKGVKVNKYGCPIDSDHDGVPNYLDKCPNTPKGVKVNKYGCPVSFNFNIQFSVNSSKIKQEYINTIKKFAKFLKENPSYKAKIEGFTDNTGSKTYNIVLSEKRAKAIYNELINLGINKKRLSWEGFGPKNPIVPNNSSENRAKNRRVIAKLYF